MGVNVELVGKLLLDLEKKFNGKHILVLKVQSFFFMLMEPSCLNEILIDQFLMYDCLLLYALYRNIVAFILRQWRLY